MSKELLLNPPREIVSRVLPSQASMFYGCRTCEWKHSAMCPYHSEPLPSEGICLQRKNYLKSFIRKQSCSFTEFQLDFNKGITQLEMMKDYKNLQEMRREITEMSSRLDSSTDDLSEKEDRLERKRKSWFDLMREMLRMEDSQVSREMPKKVEVEVTHLTPNDIHDVMAGKIVDLDAKESSKSTLIDITPEPTEADSESASIDILDKTEMIEGDEK